MRAFLKRLWRFLFGSNNRRLAVLATWTVVWLFISIFYGFGESSLEYHLKKGFAPSKEHEELLKIWQGNFTEASRPPAIVSYILYLPTQMLRNAWVIFLISLVATILYAPVALREEIWERITGAINFVMDKIGLAFYEFKALIGKASNPGFKGKDYRDKERQLRLKEKELEILKIEKEIKAIRGEKPSDATSEDREKRAKERINRMAEVEKIAIDKERELRKLYEEAGYPEEDIEQKIMEFRQKIYAKEVL